MLGLTSLGSLAVLGSITVLSVCLVTLSVWIWLDLLGAGQSSEPA
jgi:hypothetical protein